MTITRYDGDDAINHFYYDPPLSSDEFIARFFGERDQLITTGGILTVDMGADNDSFRGYADGGSVFMGTGNDNAAAGGRSDAQGAEVSLYGQAGDDILESFADAMKGRVNLYGGADVDLFVLSARAETVDGGSGFDFIGQVSTVSGSATTSLVATDTIISIEGQNGSDGADAISSWGTDLLKVSGVFANVGIAKVGNILQGRGGADTLRGAGASDVLIGNGFARLIEGMSGFRGDGAGDDYFRDRLTGDDNAADALYGGDGDDFLDGGGGADRLDGGAGQDTASYIGFQSSNTSGVRVNLRTGANTDGDILVSIENLVGSDFRGYAGTGDDVLYGSAAANRIDGRSGADYLNGLGGIDRLYGGADNDRLIDADGGDTLTGGSGNDTYEIGGSARIVELAGQGLDLVRSSVSVTLSTHVENLTLTGSGDIAGNGNAGANVLVGNAGANSLNGKAGADTMRGLGGDDTYYVDDAGDIVVETARGGTDTLLTSVNYRLDAAHAIETLATTSARATTAITLTGNDVAQAITGNAGANVIEGKGGKDVLTGLGGADTFVFASALDGRTNVDTITDFAVSTASVHDAIHLDTRIFSVFLVGNLAETAFKNLGKGPVDADDRILYDPNSGALSYDTDGDGTAAAVRFALIANRASLTAEDFLLV